MAIEFPSNPITGQTYTDGNKTFTYNGKGWTTSLSSVALTTAGISEQNNLYYTNARAYANTLSAIKTGNGIVYNSSTGNITLSATGITAGQYGNSTHYTGITVNEYGIVTSANSFQTISTGKAIAMSIVFGG